MSCTNCSETDCLKEPEEVNGLHYVKCAHAGRMPRVLNQNIKIWTMFGLIKNSRLFKHYPFLLRAYVEGLDIRFSESEISRLNFLYTMYINEIQKKHPAYWMQSVFNT